MRNASPSPIYPPLLYCLVNPVPLRETSFRSGYDPVLVLTAELCRFLETPAGLNVCLAVRAEPFLVTTLENYGMFLSAGASLGL